MGTFPKNEVWNPIGIEDLVDVKSIKTIASATVLKDYRKLLLVVFPEDSM